MHVHYLTRTMVLFEVVTLCAIHKRHSADTNLRVDTRNEFDFVFRPCGAGGHVEL